MAAPKKSGKNYLKPITDTIIKLDSIKDRKLLRIKDTTTVKVQKQNLQKAVLQKKTLQNQIKMVYHLK